MLKRSGGTVPKRWCLGLLIVGLCVTRSAGAADLSLLSKFVPPDGKIVDGFGWAGSDMNLYTTNFPAIPPYSAEMIGSFVGYENRGVTPFENFVSAYPGKALKIDIHFDDREEEIPLGLHDDILIAFANFFNSHSDVPFYLRLGGEVNGAWNDYGAGPEYIAAARYIVDFYDNMGVTNVAFIWNLHIHGVGANLYNWLNWYPGDQYVHYWSHEVLGDYGMDNDSAPAVIAQRAFCLDAVSRGLPVCLPECMAWHFGVDDGQADWDAWFAGFFEHVNNPAYGIKAYWHLPLDWSSINGGWTGTDHEKSTRVHENATVAANWLAEVSKSQYLHEGDGFSVIGFPCETTPPANVINLTLTSDEGQITLSWINPGDADLKGIKIIRRTAGRPTGPRLNPSNTGSWPADSIQLANLNRDVTSFVDTDIVDGQDYYYAVYAYDPVRNYASGKHVDTVELFLVGPATGTIALVITGLSIVALFAKRKMTTGK
ncbi:hypothetical protein ACFL1X_13245 [Candidatus Hydrogenedentota bacterium]